MKKQNILKVTANAKINLYLDVIGKREDGYHNLETIFHSIDLHDEVILSERKEAGISIHCNHPDVPTDHRNLAYRAAKSLSDEVGGIGGLDIHLNKRIPVAAGLAGGSANAAATLLGVNHLFGLGVPEDIIIRIGTKLGADVPFCIQGGAAYGTGIGDILTPLPPLEDVSLLLVNSGVQISTKDVFDKLQISLTRCSNNSIIIKSYVATSDLIGIADNLYNLLEKPVFTDHPELVDLKTELSKQEGCLGVLMSGSGATLFALMENFTAAHRCKTIFENRVSFCTTTETNSVGVYIDN